MCSSRSMSATGPRARAPVPHRPTRCRWKNPAHPFRHAPLKLTSVPTLLIHGTHKRLQDDELQALAKIELLFDE